MNRKMLPAGMAEVDIIEMSQDEAIQYKNKFLKILHTEDGFDLYFFINPYQSYTKHKSSATKKAKALYIDNKLPAITGNIVLTGVNHNIHNLIVYEYKV